MPRATAKAGGQAADFALLDAFWREPVERAVLPNGLTLIVKPDHAAALVSVQVWVKTGSLHEGAQLGAGLSHYLEHLLFKGSARRSGREISATVQAQGGYINAYTTFDRTVYYIDLPSEGLEPAVDVLADAVLRSTLPPEEVRKEKDVILREIAMTRDDPDHRLWDTLFATAFREHPYRYPIIGHREVFAAVEREDLAAYYRARYVPNNLVVVIVGDVGAAAARAVVERHFGAAPRARLAPVLVPAEPAQLAARAAHAEEAVEVTRAVLAWPIPGLTHPDAPVLDLLAMILGHGDSSVLWREVRERAGLVHTVDASSWNPGSSGLFCVSFTCEPARRKAATAAIERVLARCAQRGFAAGAIRKAFRQMVVGEISARQTVSGQASRLGAAEVVVGDLEHGRAYFQRLARVTAAELRRTLRRYLRPEVQTAVSINPAPPAAAAAAAAPAGRAAARPEFSQVRLPNGARLLLQRDARLPTVHLRLLLQGGAATESAGRRGATALLATMLTKDTRRHRAAAVAQRIEAVGGQFFPFSGNDSLGLGVETLPPDAGLGLAVLAEAVLAPAFRPATFDLERDAQLAGLRQDADEVVTFARKLLRRRFFGAHPLAIDPDGDEAGVAALRPADLVALHRRLAVGGNIVLAVAGDFDPGRLVPALKAFLARLPRGAAAGGGRPGPGPAEAGDFTVVQAREQAVVMQAFSGPVRDAPDYFVGEVADELFSSMASRLFERVREEKGLAYFVRSSRVTGLDAAMFSFFAGTQPGREAEVLAEIDAEIARVRSGRVEEVELRRCQARLKAGWRQGLQTPSARAMRAGIDVLQGRPIDDWTRYDGRIDAVTVADLAAFARRYFERTQRLQLVVGPSVA
jgi:zinc protease